MTEQEKELLLKDLCARLPYCTIVNVDNGKYREDVKLKPFHFNDFNNWDVKPYLRPMSSMTLEEKAYYEILRSTDEKYFHLTDWLNATHFDYRGLIPMGLALEAPERMY